jgi:hypothetical protein
VLRKLGDRMEPNCAIKDGVAITQVITGDHAQESKIKLEESITVKSADYLNSRLDCSGLPHRTFLKESPI